MKRILMIITSLLFIICLISCNESKEKVNICFIIEETSQIVQINKGSSINKDIIPLIQKNEVVELYYDENCKICYENEQILKDVTLYVKVLNGKNQIGQFQNLISAYEKGLLNYQNLKNISENYNNKYYNEKIPENIQNLIKNDYLYYILNEENVAIKETSLNDVEIVGFYGQYNNFYVIRISDCFFDYPTIQEFLTIEDITFIYSGPNFIVWNYDI